MGPRKIGKTERERKKVECLFPPGKKATCPQRNKSGNGSRKRGGRRKTHFSSHISKEEKKEKKIERERMFILYILFSLCFSLFPYAMKLSLEQNSSWLAREGRNIFTMK